MHHMSALVYILPSLCSIRVHYFIFTFALLHNECISLYFPLLCTIMSALVYYNEYIGLYLPSLCTIMSVSDHVCLFS